MAGFKGLRPKHGGIEIRAQVNGRRYHWFIKKNWNPTNCREASRLRSQYVAEIKAGGSHLSGENPDFAAVAQGYLDSIRKHGYSDQHIKNTKLELNRRWLPYLGELRIRDIAVRHCRAADEDIEWSSAKRQQNARSILRQVFEYAIEYEYIDTNPAAKLKKVSHQRAKIDPFNEKEKDAILACLSGESLHYFTLAFETGLRTAELLGLEWADIRDGKLHLHQTLVNGQLSTMKTKVERSVYLSPAALEALTVDIRPLSGPVFTLSRKQLWRRVGAGIASKRLFGMQLVSGICSREGK